jgi:hypothetical protein
LTPSAPTIRSAERTSPVLRVIVGPELEEGEGLQETTVLLRRRLTQGSTRSRRSRWKSARC